jgi:hypothetical protein
VLPVVPLLWPEPLQQQQQQASGDIMPSTLPLPPLKLAQPQQQQQQHSPGTPSQRRVSKLVSQIHMCRTCWDVCKLVMQQTSYKEGRSNSEALCVAEGWTADVLAVALYRFRKLTPYTVSRQEGAPGGGG